MERSQNRKVAVWLKGKGIYFIKHYGCAYSRVGVPDFLICLEGKFVGVEMKDRGKKPTVRQEIELNKIRELGGIAAWFDNAEDAINWLEELLCLTRPSKPTNEKQLSLPF